MSSAINPGAKQKRNWPFWLAAAAMIVVGLGLTVALWFAGGRAELRRAREELRASGMPTTVEEIAPPPVPSSENAAVVYAKAVQQSRNISKRFGKTAYDIEAGARDFDEIPPERWPEDDKRRLSEYMEGMSPVVELTRAASRLQKCRFPMDYSQGANMQPRHHAGMRGLARVMRLDCLDRLGKGDVDGAIASGLAGLSAARHTGSDPTLIGMLVSRACRKITLDAVDALLQYGGLTQAQLERVLAALEREAPTPDVKSVLETETWIGLDTYARMRRRTSDSGGRHIPWHWVADRDEARFIRTMVRLARLACRPYLEANPEFERIVSEAGSLSWHLYPTARYSVAQWAGLLTSAAAAEAELETRRLSVAALIFESKHGAFPGRLSDLVPEIISKTPVDPFSGKPYVYRREPGGFLVYSLDWNLRDDRGRPSSKVGRGKGDIVFRFEAKP